MVKGFDSVGILDLLSPLNNAAILSIEWPFDPVVPVPPLVRKPTLTRSLCVRPFSVPAITLQFCCCKEGWQSVLVKLVNTKLSLLTVPAKKSLLKIVIYNDS